MKKIIQTAGCGLLLLAGGEAKACITCNRQVQEAIFDGSFYPNLFVMLSAFIVLAAVVALLSRMTASRHKTYAARFPGKNIPTPVPLTAAATVLGIGIGGFIDGIFLHQILQWHEMLSNRLPPTTLVAKSVNMFWDGIFHAFTLLVTVIGIVLLWKLLHRRDADKSGNLLGGGMLIGWGVFNIIEGVIDHHILKLHNVREITPNPEAWNWGFLLFSVLLLGAGFSIAKKRHEAHEHSTSH